MNSTSDESDAVHRDPLFAVIRALSHEEGQRDLFNRATPFFVAYRKVAFIKAVIPMDSVENLLRGGKFAHPPNLSRVKSTSSLTIGVCIRLCTRRALEHDVRMARLVRLLGSFVLGAVLLPARLVLAQDCDCNHTINVSTNSVNGADLGVAPGDVVCIEAGERPFLSLDSFVGTQSAPIIIKNCGGQVLIDNPDKGYGLRIVASSFFRVTGTGDPAVFYGFDIAARRTGPDYSAMCVAVSGLSTNYELDHMEVHHAGFAGFNLKTEPTCDGSANLGSFVQYDTRVHHTYVHDTGGEAFYVGSTGYGGRDYQCDGQTVTLHPHEHEGVYLHDNVIEDTGWDGLQVGVTPKDCEVFRNVIRRVGRTATDSVQTRGIQIGGASACKIYDNYLEDGPTIGIFVLGASDTSVTNNVVVGFKEDGIYANDQQNDGVQGASYVFLHNTIVDSGDTGLSVFGTRIQGNGAWNNLIVGSAGDSLSIGGDVDWQGDANLSFDTTSEVGFVDAEGLDFHLLSTSSARDVGVEIPEHEVTHDRDGVERDSEPDVGAYEYTDAAPPDGGLGGNGGTGGSDAGTSGGSGGVSTGAGGDAGAAVTMAEANEDSGCGCRQARPSRSSAELLLLLAFIAMIQRKRIPHTL